MGEQNGTKVSTKPHRSRQTKQNDIDATPLQQPTKDDKEAWRAYWKANGQSWRAEPEIDIERQLYLERRRNIEPDVEQGIFPFKDINPKLSRADIEWLLATHENGLGPVDWKDESQRQREGLDLRGADLRYVDLVGLPLARTIAGPRQVSFGEVDVQDKAATVRLAACRRERRSNHSSRFAPPLLRAYLMTDLCLQHKNRVGNLLKAKYNRSEG